MTRQVIATPHAPAAVGPYSQAIRAGNLVFTAGQIGLDPSTGKLVEGLEKQVEQVLANLRAVLEAAGTSLDQAIKTTIFLADMADFAQVNAIYGRAFSVTPPARSTVQAAGLPLGALVEIEVIALISD
ncbi:MAG: RidA family protein [Anaerolineae bacterium]|mgnify:CR=1 FL=1|nr:RidA family protein [Anaerolineae bacterium]MCB9130979.1 RidA family protein [Anaerolineales bacterium]MCB0227724.1 RidA family protein [Anaerolineae bacterium]MCB0232860.1 RidA family protein [Anaerolineae bacterium]MCB0238955.1 RidA family protein [Anaerolineae bacterium]